MATAPLSYKQKFVLPDAQEGKLGIFKDICLFLQEVATTHSIQMGISINTLQAANLTWVLARQQSFLKTLPKSN